MASPGLGAPSALVLDFLKGRVLVIVREHRPDWDLQQTSKPPRSRCPAAEEASGLQAGRSREVTDLLCFQNIPLGAQTETSQRDCPRGFPPDPRCSYLPMTWDPFLNLRTLDPSLLA